MNSDKNWGLQIDPRVFKDLEGVRRKDAERILFMMNTMKYDPFTGDIQKMKGERNVWRRRVGAYRIFYEIITEGRIIHVFHIERRGSKTY